VKICSNCGASNPDAARFCNECAQSLAMTATVVPPAGSPVSVHSRPTVSGAASFADAIQKKPMARGRKADVLFVLDCTGSMQGEVNAIRDSIIGFANTIESDGVRVRVGLIEFRDRLIGEEAKVLKFEGQTFTSKPTLFRAALAKLVADGGGDAPESSLDAMMLALRQPFAADGNKVMVLITDAPPHIPDKETRSIDQVKQAMKDIGVEQFYLVMRTQDIESQVYLKLLEGVRGLAFELGNGDDFRSRADHFKRTLMTLGKTISAATT
jgi:Mg-chelatase subunit ChlD